MSAAELEVRVDRDGDRWLAYVPSARVLAYGETEGDAKGAAIAAALQVDDPPRLDSAPAGRVRRALDRLGWREHLSAGPPFLRRRGCQDIPWPWADDDELGSLAVTVIAELAAVRVGDLGIAPDREELTRARVLLEGELPKFQSEPPPARASIGRTSRPRPASSTSRPWSGVVAPGRCRRGHALRGVAAEVPATGQAAEEVAPEGAPLKRTRPSGTGKCKARSLGTELVPFGDGAITVHTLNTGARVAPV